MEETVSGRATERWPAHLRPGALRWARSSHHYQDTVRFYRDLVGLPVVGSFTASFGEDGTVFGLPGDGVQLEIVRGSEAHRRPDPFDQVVFYFPDADAVASATRALREYGLTPDPSLHAYWAANGAEMYVDPDGRGVVYAPWIYGLAPDPVDRPVPSTDTGGPRIETYTGDREQLRPLFELAEDSAPQLNSYLGSGRILVARVGDDVIGHLQLVDTDEFAEVELKNMAVLPAHQGRGIGQQLVQAAIALVTSEGKASILVATAAADIGNLRFYQRQGFRMRSIEQDAFTSETGYPPDIVIDGIILRDRVWLDLTLES